jgi:2-amino-4-hydroxy-6-hydroxymethyldihydropteridine diphosphokinase
VLQVRRAVIGLGSNLGDRVGHIEAAIDRLRADADLEVVERSPIYETEPVGGPPQGDYLNAALLVLTSLEGRALLERLLAVEASLGRVRAERNGPRTIDLDLLWIEGERISEPGLEVPHPRLGERSFALRPLLDLVADARDAATGARLADLPAASAPIAPHQTR